MWIDSKWSQLSQAIHSQVRLFQHRADALFPVWINAMKNHSRVIICFYPLHCFSFKGREVTWKRPLKWQRFKLLSLFVFFFATASDRIFIETHTLNCLQVRPCIIQLGNFTGWGSEGVKVTHRHTLLTSPSDSSKTRSSAAELTATLSKDTCIPQWPQAGSFVADPLHTHLAKNREREKNYKQHERVTCASRIGSRHIYCPPADSLNSHELTPSLPWCHLKTTIYCPPADTLNSHELTPSPPWCHLKTTIYCPSADTLNSHELTPSPPWYHLKTTIYCPSADSLTRINPFTAMMSVENDLYWPYAN